MRSEEVSKMMEGCWFGFLDFLGSRFAETTGGGVDLAGCAGAGVGVRGCPGLGGACRGGGGGGLRLMRMERTGTDQ